MFNASVFSFAAIANLLAEEDVLAQASEPREGKEFTQIHPSLPSLADGRIDVAEFFSYACPACNAFDPSLTKWTRGLRPDIRFRRVPVPFLANSENFQRTYYALESLGLLDTCHSKIFAAVHVERLRLSTVQEIAAVVGNSGGNAQMFVSTFNSFGVATAVARAKKLTNEFGIESIPTLALQSKYLTSPVMAGGAAQTLAVADALLAKLRRS